MMCLIFVFITNLEASCVKTGILLFCFDLCVFLAFPFLATLLANCRFSVRTCWIEKVMSTMLFSFYLLLMFYLIYSFLWTLSECLYKTLLGRTIVILSNLNDMWLLLGLENDLHRPKMKIRMKSIWILQVFMIVSHRKIQWDLK